MTEPEHRRSWSPRARAVAALAGLFLGLTAVWGCTVRTTHGGRAVTVHDVPAALHGSPVPDAPTGVPSPPEPGPAAPVGGGQPPTDRAGDGPARDTLRILAWNIAHGRGDLMQGNLQNFRGGDPVDRNARMARMAEVILAADADIVVLNEVDFDAAWSGGLNQARTLAWATGYTAWVEQRNFDYSLLFADFAFGNAVLTRRPVRAAREVPLPPHSRLEAALIGAKTASLVEIETRAGPVGVVPIHLEFRSEATRLAAVPALRALADDAPPLILAGDFNTTPPSWHRARDSTALGRLLDAGLTSPRARNGPAGVQRTYPSRDPSRAIDWVLAESPIRVLDARVLTHAAPLSDHLPVLATVEVR